MPEFVKERPYIPIEDNLTGEILKVQRCAFVFKDHLSEVDFAMIEKDPSLIIHPINGGYFLSHFLDDAGWADRVGVRITMVYPANERDFPSTLSPKNVLFH